MTDGGIIGLILIQLVHECQGLVHDNRVVHVTKG